MCVYHYVPIRFQFVPCIFTFLFHLALLLSSAAYLSNYKTLKGDYRLKIVFLAILFPLFLLLSIAVCFWAACVRVSISVLYM